MATRSAASRLAGRRGYATQEFLPGVGSPYSGVKQTNYPQGTLPTGEAYVSNQGPGQGGGTYDSHGSYQGDAGERANAVQLGLAAGWTQDAYGIMHPPSGGSTPTAQPLRSQSLMSSMQQTTPTAGPIPLPLQQRSLLDTMRRLSTASAPQGSTNTSPLYRRSLT